MVGTSGVTLEGVRLQDMFLTGNTSRSAPKHSVLEIKIFKMLIRHLKGYLLRGQT